MGDRVCGKRQGAISGQGGKRVGLGGNFKGLELGKLTKSISFDCKVMPTFQLCGYDIIFV